MIEQLWFGWSAVGLEGSNRQQVIAASPGLRDTKAPLTMAALKYCYGVAEPTTGWCETDGIRVVFRRTPLGLDGRGRPGKYFVHALVGTSQDLRPAVLPAVLSGRLLRSEAAADVDTVLELVRPDAVAPAQLSTEHPEGVAALGHYLANLSAGRLTAFAATPDEAALLAAFVTRLMPEPLGLVGFSQRETAAESTQYDLTAAPAPTPLFAEVDPSAEPPGAWRYAVQVLLDAANGDAVASDCVRVLASQASSRREFAIMLGHWCAVERGDEQAINTDALRWLDGEPALRHRVAQLPALDVIVARAVRGDATAGAVLEHNVTIDRVPILEPVCRAIASAVAAGLDGLVRAGAHTVVRGVVSRLATKPIDLSPLRLESQRALLALFLPEDRLTKPVSCLLANVQLAASIVGDPDWPVSWQVHAARAHAGRLSTGAINLFLSRWPDQAGALCAAGAPAPLIEQVGLAVDEFDVATASRIWAGSRGRIPEPIARQWWVSIYQRQDPLTQLAVLHDKARSGGYATAAMGVAAFASAVEWCATRGVELPPTGQLGRVLHGRGGNPDSAALLQACRVVEAVNPYQLDPGSLNWALHSIQQLDRKRLRWAMSEILVWRLLEIPDSAAFRPAMAAVRQFLEPASDTAPRVVRGARVIARRNGEAARHLVRWTVDALNREDDAPPILQTMDPAVVRELLTSTGQQTIVEALREYADTKAARRWLNSVEPARKRIPFPFPW